MDNRISLDDVTFLGERFILYWSDAEGNSYDLEVNLKDLFRKHFSEETEYYLSEHK